jgi:sulfite exporter TauE/SafE
MYIVAIAWLYVTLLMAATETNVVAGVMTFLVYGLGPLALLLWLTGGPRRKRERVRREAIAVSRPGDPPDGAVD